MTYPYKLRTDITNKTNSFIITDISDTLSGIIINFESKTYCNIRDSVYDFVKMPADLKSTVRLNVENKTMDYKFY